MNNSIHNKGLHVRLLYCLCNTVAEWTYTDVLCQGDHPLAAFNTGGQWLLAWRQSFLRRRTVQTVRLHLLWS